MRNQTHKVIFVWSAAALAWTAGIASAQLTPSDRAAAAGQGFTAGDFRAFDVTQIAPSFAPFTAWRTCVRQAVEPTIRQRSPEETQAIVLGLCGEKEAEARSVIAGRTSLANAMRVMKLARAVEIQRINALDAALNPPRETGSQTLAGWEVKLDQSACRAAIKTEDLFAPGMFVLGGVAGHQCRGSLSSCWAVT